MPPSVKLHVPPLTDMMHHAYAVKATHGHSSRTLVDLIRYIAWRQDSPCSRGCALRLAFIHEPQGLPHKTVRMQHAAQTDRLEARDLFPCKQLLLNPWGLVLRMLVLG